VNISKQPTTAVPLKFHHIFSGFRGIVCKSGIKKFESAFADFIGTRHAIAAGNGTTAFYAALLAMKEVRPERDEVVIPAYTVPVLVLAINMAGLKTKLCDIERDTFNIESGSMISAMTDRTLAVVPVHMFGFPCALEKILTTCKERDIFMIEDTCQAPGAKLNGKRVGSIGDAGFFSLCKGKNITTFHGGVLTTDNDMLAVKIRSAIEKLPQQNFLHFIGIPAVLTALSLAMRPWFYGMFYSQIERFKDTKVHPSFHPSKYNGFMAGVAQALLPDLERWNAVRAENGKKIMEKLEQDVGIILPRIINGAESVYNHIPLVFHDQDRMEKTRKKLWEHGIDTGRMYERSINHIYNLGYKEITEPFPHAAYIAPRLLTIPSHPYLDNKSVETIIAVILSTI